MSNRSGRRQSLLRVVEVASAVTAPTVLVIGAGAWLLRADSPCSFAAAAPLSPVAQVDDATRFSYGVGFDLGEKVRDGLRTDGQNADLGAIVRGFEDGLNGRPPEIPRDELNRVLRAVHDMLLQRAAAKRYESDPEFKALADRNAALSKEAMNVFTAEKPVQELESGVPYRVLASGPVEAPTIGDSSAVVSFSIYGADARKIDERKEVTLDPSALLPVAAKALSTMRPGDHWLIAIPPEKAFGLGGEPPEIGPNEVLIVDVSVRRAVPRAEAAPGAGGGK